MELKIKFRTFLIMFSSLSLISIGALTSPVSATLEELEEPLIPPPQLEKPKVQDLNKTDTKGVSPKQLDKPNFYPNGISVDLSGNVFVSDQGHEDEAQYRMIKYTTDGFFIKSWGKYGSGKSQFNNPDGVGVDSKGNVFVADTLNDRIQKFDNNGDFINGWPIAGTSNDGWGPSDVDADLHPSFGNVYVTDTQKDRILVYTNNGAKMLKTWGKFGDGNGEFHHPSAVAVDNKGNIFVADGGNDRIQKFQLANPCPKGTFPLATPGVCFIKSWGTTGTGNNQFNHPDGINVDSNGNVFVADSVNDRIQKFTNNGNFIKSWGNDGTDNGNFKSPGDIDIDTNTGNVFVADTLNNRIQKFDNNGMFISKWYLPGIPK